MRARILWPSKATWSSRQEDSWRFAPARKRSIVAISSYCVSGESFGSDRIAQLLHGLDTIFQGRWPSAAPNDARFHLLHAFSRRRNLQSISKDTPATSPNIALSLCQPIPALGAYSVTGAGRNRKLHGLQMLPSFPADRAVVAEWQRRLQVFECRNRSASQTTERGGCL
jgi:hypothetical protein